MGIVFTLVLYVLSQINAQIISNYHNNYVVSSGPGKQGTVILVLWLILLNRYEDISEIRVVQAVSSWSFLCSK